MQAVRYKRSWLLFGNKLICKMKGHAKYLGVLEALQLNLVGTGSSCLACWISSIRGCCMILGGWWWWGGTEMEKGEPGEHFAAWSR